MASPELLIKKDVTTQDTYVSQQARKALFGIAKEQVTEVEAKVTGEMPTWLTGSLLVNGGGAFVPAMQHLFDGYAMCVKLRIDAQRRVWGSQRYIQSEAYKHYKRTGKMRWREFSSAPATMLESIFSTLDMFLLMALGRQATTDNSSVNFIPLKDGSLLSLAETILSQYRVDPDKCETMGQVKVDASDGIAGALTTAHPQRMRDGTLVNISRVVPNGGMTVFKQDPLTLKRTRIAYIKDRNPMSPAWIHDLAMSEHYLVVCETPMQFNMASLLLGTAAQHIFMDWKPENGSRVHLVALDGSGVQTFDTPPWFAFHYANAHEAVQADGSRVLHLDLALYPGPEIMLGLNLDRLKEFPGKEVAECAPYRLTVPLDGLPSSREAPRKLPAPIPLAKQGTVVDQYFEFPTIAPGYIGRPYRHLYGCGSVRPTNMSNALVKFDVLDGTSRIWHEAGAMPGEPRFIPRPGATREDDGVVLSLLAAADGSAVLLVLDGTDFKEVARATLPYSAPYRFHGTWLPEA